MSAITYFVSVNIQYVCTLTMLTLNKHVKKKKKILRYRFTSKLQICASRLQKKRINFGLKIK